jgi:hypothetical protein
VPAVTVHTSSVSGVVPESMFISSPQMLMGFADMFSRSNMTPAWPFEVVMFHVVNGVPQDEPCAWIAAASRAAVDMRERNFIVNSSKIDGCAGRETRHVTEEYGEVPEEMQLDCNRRRNVCF